MAERSFASEVKKLRLGQGELFRGEGILAITKALLESGVAYVGGYQGAPISHLMDVFGDAQDILSEYNVRFENSASEAAAAATLSASVNYPLRGAVTFKAPVGTNVASDALSNLTSGGVTGGALIIVGEDYGEGSSIMQERSHAFAMKSQMWLLDPRPNLPSLVNAVKMGFELSEASNTPVMLEMRIRSCHMHGTFIASDNRASAATTRDAVEHPAPPDVNRIVLPPASFAHERDKVDNRWPAAVKFVQDHNLNEFFAEDVADAGIVMQGGMYNSVIRALEHLGIANVYGDSTIPLYVMNVTYPHIDAEFERFCKGKRAILMVEEGQPNFIEQSVADVLLKLEIPVKLHGKDFLPMAGDYNLASVFVGLRDFLAEYGFVDASKFPTPVADAHPVGGTDVQRRARKALQRQRRKTEKTSLPRVPDDASAQPVAEQSPAKAISSAVGGVVYGRPPTMCTGCPERPIFSAVKLVERQIGPHHMSADIGCQLFSILPPFHLGSTTMGYGLGGASGSAFNVPAGAKPANRRAISVMGDGGFWHNGLTSGVANAVFNRSDNLIIIVDNNYTAATGGQDIPSSRINVKDSRSAAHAIEDACRGVGVKWIRTIRRTYDTKAMMDAIREGLTTDERGPKVIVAQSECMLNKERREKPLRNKRIAGGKRVVRDRYGVDADTCTGDHSCIRLSGCPSLTVKDNPDPLREDPVTTTLDSCVGCGHCGEVAEAAVLCPSFYRARMISNPSLKDHFAEGVRAPVIRFLQGVEAKRRERRVF